MYDDYDFNQEDDFQRLVEGRCSDDEEFFKEHSKKSQKTSKSFRGDRLESGNKKSTKPSAVANKRKRDLELEDEDSNSVDLREDDRLFDKYASKYGSKFDRYERSEDEDDYGDNDPVNPEDEAEEEPEKKAKSQKEGDGEEKPKRKNVVRNPRVMLNDDKLKSSDGVIKLPELFKQTKFKGKNHEKEDLNAIMGVYKNWAHRLMPSLQFDDFVERAEMLCRKAKMKVFLNKIRNNMPLDVRDKPGEQPNNDETVQQYDDSQDEGDLIGGKPDLVPKTMEEEFMGDDIDWDDNEAMDGLGESAKQDASMKSVTNAAEDVRQVVEEGNRESNNSQENQESRLSAKSNKQLLDNKEKQGESSPPVEKEDIDRVESDSLAEMAEKMETSDKQEKEESLSKEEESSVKATEGLQSVGSQSDEPKSDESKPDSTTTVDPELVASVPEAPQEDME